MRLGEPVSRWATALVIIIAALTTAAIATRSSILIYLIIATLTAASIGIIQALKKGAERRRQATAEQDAIREQLATVTQNQVWLASGIEALTAAQHEAARKIARAVAADLAIRRAPISPNDEPGSDEPPRGGGGKLIALPGVAIMAGAIETARKHPRAVGATGATALAAAGVALALSIGGSTRSTPPTAATLPPPVAGHATPAAPEPAAPTRRRPLPPPANPPTLGKRKGSAPPAYVPSTIPAVLSVADIVTTQPLATSDAPTATPGAPATTLAPTTTSASTPTPTPSQASSPTCLLRLNILGINVDVCT
jgi:hypothetical protein